MTKLAMSSSLNLHYSSTNLNTFCEIWSQHLKKKKKKKLPERERETETERQGNMAGQILQPILKPHYLKQDIPKLSI